MPECSALAMMCRFRLQVFSCFEERDFLGGTGLENEKERLALFSRVRGEIRDLVGTLPCTVENEKLFIKEVYKGNTKPTWIMFSSKSTDWRLELARMNW